MLPSFHKLKHFRAKINKFDNKPKEIYVLIIKFCVDLCFKLGTKSVILVKHNPKKSE